MRFGAGGATHPPYILQTRLTEMEDTQIVNPYDDDDASANDVRDVREVGAGIALAITVAIVAFLRIMKPILAFVGALAIVAFAFLTLHQLAQTFKMQPATGLLAASVTTGVAVVLGLHLWLHNEATNAERGLSGIFFGAWLGILIVLALTSLAVNNGIAIIPNEVVNLGAFAYAALAGLSLLPLLIVPIVARRVPNDKYSSAWQAAGAFFGFVMKLAGFAASAAGAFFFGIQNNMPVLYTVFAAVVIECGALYAIAQVDRSKTRGDRFDTRMWQVVAALFIGYLVLVSGEAVQSFAGWQFMPEWVHTAARLLYSYALGVTLLVIGATSLLTRAIDDDIPAGGVTIRQPIASRIAGSIRGARAGIEEIRDAALGLPSPQRIMLGDDGNDRLRFRPADNDQAAAADPKDPKASGRTEG